MKKIIFYLITVLVFLPTFVVATDVDKIDDDAIYKNFEVKTDNGMEYSVKCHGTRESDISMFNVQNDNYNFAVRDIADYYESIDYEKYSVEKIKNGFAILYDKAEKIKFIYDLDKKVWTITLKGANSTSKYSVEFSLIESNDNTLFNDARKWGVYGSSNNKKIFSDMKVAYNNEKYYDVPLSAYSDMVDMRSYYLYPITDGFGLIIEGSNTAENYTANFTFKKGLLMRKEIRNGEFYGDVWEQIFYSYNELEN